MKSTSTIKRNRQQKYSALGANFAINMAQQRNDPLYKKYKRYRDLFIDNKRKIIDKYGSIGRMQARQHNK